MIWGGQEKHFSLCLEADPGKNYVYPVEYELSILHFFLSALSILLCATGVKLSLSRGRASKKYSFVLVVYFLLYIAYAVFYGVCYYFTGKGVDRAVLYHVKYGLDGAGYGEYSRLILVATVALCFLFVTSCYLLFRYSRSKTKLPRRFIFLSVFFLFLSVLVHPATADLYNLSKTDEGEPFYKYYRTPYIRSTGEGPKNFILIYAESLERTYFDEEIFPGLITNLRELESESISFTDIGRYPETGWTIAGMVASQCGIPLIAPSHGNSMSEMDSFLAGADCMGDLLSRKGYHLTFMGGASLNFAGKGKFYQSHGFDEVLGRTALFPLLPDPSYRTQWGLHDDSLFNLALEKYEDLSRGEKPFGLFLLTLDTHGSDNHFSRSCEGMAYGDGENGMLNAVACSDYQIGNFIDRVRQSSYFRDTVIVVVSDHQAMRNSAYKMLKKSRKRRNLFLVFDPEIESGFKSSKRGSTLDIGITLLSVLGFESYLGLGRDLLQEEPSILEGVKHIDTTLNAWRKEIIKFWAFPKVNDSVKFYPRMKKFTVDDRMFSTPVLIQYDEKLQTKMWFEPYIEPGHKTLLGTLKGFAPETPFVLVNACKSMPVEWVGPQEGGVCLVSGKLGSAEITGEQIVAPVLLTAEQLQEIAAIQVSAEVYNSNLKQITLAQKKK